MRIETALYLKAYEIIVLLMWKEPLNRLDNLSSQRPKQRNTTNRRASSSRH